MSIPYPAETNDGEVTSWIPLTTVWPSVSGCSDSFMLEGTRLVAFDPGYGISIDPAATCQPSAVTTWWEQGRLGGGSGTGHTAVSILPLTCPKGFSTVVTSIKDESSTLAMCCPPGYTLENADPGTVDGDCISTVPSGATLTYASTAVSNSNTWTITSTTLDAASTVGAIGVVGWNVKLAAAATTSSTTTTSSQTSISSATASSSPSKTASPSSGLSTGAKTGIGVGIAVVIIGLIALAASLWVSHRRKATAAAKRDTTLHPGGFVPKPELDSTPVAPARTARQAYEMDGRPSTGPHELL